MTKRFTYEHEGNEYFIYYESLLLSPKYLVNLLNEQDERIQELESLFPSKTCKWMDKEDIAIRCDKYRDYRHCNEQMNCFEEGSWSDR